MTKVCLFTGKKNKFGRSRSHAMNQTKRKFKANIFTKMIDVGSGIKVKINISSKAYRKFKGMI